MVRAIMIVEMAGRPAGHLTASLEKHVKILKEIIDIEVHSIKVSKPQEIPRPEDKKVSEDEIMFTAFAECDFETDNFSRLTQTMFDFMPSSVEVIEPSKINMDFTEATDLLNNISGRLHRYDEFAKVAGEKMKFMESQIEKAKEIIGNKDDRIRELENETREALKGNEKKKPAEKKIEVKKIEKKTPGKKKAEKKDKKKSKKKKPVSNI